MSELPVCPRCGGDLFARPGPYRGVIARCAGCSLEFDVELKPRQEPFALPVDASPFGLRANGATPFPSPPLDPQSDIPAPFGAPDVGRDARRVASAVDLPRGFSLDTSPDALDIRWRWWTPAHVFILVFAGFWDLFMVFWYTIAIAGGEWMMAAFGTLHAMVGAGLAYWAVAGLVNHTTVSIRPRHVAVAHGPLPWPGVRPLPREEVDQLYVSRQELRNKGSVQISFEVRVLRRDGSELSLVRGLTSADQASFLEARIEAALGIEDRPVPGEHHPEGRGPVSRPPPAP